MSHSLYTQTFNVGTDIGRPVVINNDGFASPAGVNNAKTIYRNTDAIYKGTSTSNTKFLHFGNSGDNLFLGEDAGSLNTTGNNNIAIGINSLGSNTTGMWNTALGTASLLSNTTGELNIAIGRFAGNGNSIGLTPSHKNIDIHGNTYIGSRTGANTIATGNTNSVVIGNLASFSSINTIVLGSVNGINGSDITQSVITGGVSVDSSAQLQVDSTNRGLLPPRMTTTQRNAIVAPAEGLVIHNITTHSLNVFNGTSWVDLGAISNSDDYYSADTANTGTVIATRATNSSFTHYTVPFTTNRIHVLSTAGAILGDSMTVSIGYNGVDVLPGTNVLEVRNATAGGTLIETLTDGLGIEGNYKFNGTAWVKVR